MCVLVYILVCVCVCVCVCVYCVHVCVHVWQISIEQPKGYKTNMDSFSMQITDNLPTFPMPNFPYAKLSHFILTCACLSEIY